MERRKSIHSGYNTESFSAYQMKTCWVWKRAVSNILCRLLRNPVKQNCVSETFLTKTEFNEHTNEMITRIPALDLHSVPNTVLYMRQEGLIYIDKIAGVWFADQLASEEYVFG